MPAGPGVLGHEYQAREKIVSSSESDETDSTESSESGVVPRDPRPVSPIAAPEVCIILLFAFIVVRTPPNVYHVPILFSASVCGDRRTTHLCVTKLKLVAL